MLAIVTAAFAADPAGVVGRIQPPTVTFSVVEGAPSGAPSVGQRIAAENALLEVVRPAATTLQRCDPADPIDLRVTIGADGARTVGVWAEAIEITPRDLEIAHGDAVLAARVAAARRGTPPPSLAALCVADALGGLVPPALPKETLPYTFRLRVLPAR